MIDIKGGGSLHFGTELMASVWSNGLVISSEAAHEKNAQRHRQLS
jgi:hypothetical protein